MGEISHRLRVKLCIVEPAELHGYPPEKNQADQAFFRTGKFRELRVCV